MHPPPSSSHTQVDDIEPSPELTPPEPSTANSPFQGELRADVDLGMSYDELEFAAGERGGGGKGGGMMLPSSTPALPLLGHRGNIPNPFLLFHSLLQAPPRSSAWAPSAPSTEPHTAITPHRSHKAPPLSPSPLPPLQAPPRSSAWAPSAPSTEPPTAARPLQSKSSRRPSWTGSSSGTQRMRAWRTSSRSSAGSRTQTWCTATGAA
jgi:hypothetical protein